MQPPIGSILNPLAGKFSDDIRKKGKGAKTGASHDWRSFYLSQHDWLKGSHMTKAVWLPNETDYSYCKFVAPNTPYSLQLGCTGIRSFRTTYMLHVILTASCSLLSDRDNYGFSERIRYDVLAADGCWADPV